MVGNEYSDTVLYLGRILQCMGDRVLVVDLTGGISMYYCIPHIDNIDPVSGIIDYRGLGYTACREYTRLERLREYSTVIRLYDIDMLPDTTGRTIIITDEHKLNVDTLNALGWTKPIPDGGARSRRYSDTEHARYLVIRNFTGTIRNQFNELMVSAGIRRMFEIPMSVRDERCAILAMYKNEYRFAGLSRDYVSALIGIMTELRPDTDDRMIMRAYNMAARGKMCVG